MTHPPVPWHFWRGPHKDKKGVYSKFLGKPILRNNIPSPYSHIKKLNKNHSRKEGQGCLLPKSILHSACGMDCLTINCFHLARKENIVFNLQLVESIPMGMGNPWIQRAHCIFIEKYLHVSGQCSSNPCCPRVNCTISLFVLTVEIVEHIWECLFKSYPKDGNLN